MKKTIKLNSYYMTPWMRSYYYTLLSDHFEIVETSTDPEYILVGTNQTNYVRGEEHNSHRFLAQFPDKAIRIYLQHEAVVFDTTLFDYAVLFTEDLKWDDRVFIGNFFSVGNFHYVGNDVFERLNAPKPAAGGLLAEKNVFCNFVYSHPGVPEREEMFQKLSEHGFVESYGKFLNNTNPEEKAGAASHYLHNWFQEGIDLKRASKFSIAAENALHPTGYYVSEKIVSAMLANTIPIYWGNPKVGRLFNNRAFINCHDYESFDAVLERVAEIDGDEQLWCDMMSEPWMTPDQYLEASGNQQRLKEFLTGIFDQPVESARRRARGFWVGRYENAQKRLLRDAALYRKLQVIDIPAQRRKFLAQLEGEPSVAAIHSTISDLRAMRKRIKKEQWLTFLDPDSNPKSQLMRLIVNSGTRRSDKVKLMTAFYHGKPGWGVERNRAFSARWLRDLVEDGFLQSENAPPKALLLWGLMHMTGEPPMIERNPQVALACFKRIENCPSPRIMNRALYHQVRIHLEENNIPLALEAVTRLLLSRSVEKTQVPVVLKILSHQVPLDKEQKKLVHSSLRLEKITDIGSWKVLNSWKLPWKFRRNAKRLRKSLERQGYFSPAGSPDAAERE